MAADGPERAASRSGRGTPTERTGPSARGAASTIGTGPGREEGPIQLRSRLQSEARADFSGTDVDLPTWEPADLGRPEEPFRLGPLVTAIRWATTAVSLIWLSTTDDATRANAVIGAVILSYALWRTIQPLELSGTTRREIWPILLEGVIVVTAVVATDFWESPYVFGLVTVIAAAGFAGGIPLALQASFACVAAVAVPLHLVDSRAGADVTVQWAVLLGLVAVLAGHTRRLSLAARAETSRYVGRLRQLSDVNGLLLQLRSAAQTLPISLDMAETLDSSVSRIQELLAPDVVVLLLREEGRWTVARSSGTSLPHQLTDEELPPVARQAAESTAQVLVVPLDDPMPRIGGDSRCGLYVRLTSRGDLVGLVGAERRSATPFSNHDVAVLAEFCQQMAIAVDNARWFSRIGTLAAEQERSRIARDLHDRVGQSLALVGFEVDRAAKRAGDTPVAEELLELRENVRAVVTELRETLYDLRTDVSDERDLTVAMKDFLDRVGQRSGLRTTFEHDVTRRLAVNAEREVWRIAQEAIFNAERHAHARNLAVRWTCGEDSAELTVIDDGSGMPTSGNGRSGGYGLLGMQERANAVGATLAFLPTPGGGTTVRVHLDRR